MDAKQTVLDFIAAWNARDLNRIADGLAEDVIYHNIPVNPLRGREAVRAAVGPLVGSCSSIDWEVHHIAGGEGGVVLTERTDRFIREGKALSIRVMGTFEVRDGMIVAWRDYFDMAEWQRQL